MGGRESLQIGSEEYTKLYLPVAWIELIQDFLSIAVSRTLRLKYSYVGSAFQQNKRSSVTRWFMNSLILSKSSVSENGTWCTTTEVRLENGFLQSLYTIYPEWLGYTFKTNLHSWAYCSKRWYGRYIMRINATTTNAPTSLYGCQETRSVHHSFFLSRDLYSKIIRSFLYL